MKFYLLHLKVNGIKNIANEIQLDFYNKVITKFDPNLYKIKAIYGENGSGKTAIMTAVNIAKKIVLSQGYLKQMETQSFLTEIINKINRELSMEFEFAAYDEDYFSVYRYAFLLSQNSMGGYELIRERLEVINQYTKNKKFETIYDVIDGQIVSLKASDDISSEIRESTLNVLRESSLAFRVIAGHTSASAIISDLLAVVLFFSSVNVYLDEEDMHEMYLINQILVNLQKNSSDKESRALYSMIDKQLFYIDSKGRDIVSKKNFAKYKEKVERLERFIKLFKTDLQAIRLEKRDNGETYVCELIMDYGKYTVNREFESTGIKKLIRIYDALVNADEGKISFIDEMDSNINDIYFCKLIAYFKNYGKGQLCFTTHNLDPMAIIKNNRNSIDFLSSDNKVVSWKITGNAAPDRYYRNGMIENSPFNIDDIDFIGMFGE